jgi:hypothetical protein
MVMGAVAVAVVVTVAIVSMVVVVVMVVAAAARLLQALVRPRVAFRDPCSTTLGPAP